MRSTTRARGELLYANAGHLPPLLAVPGEPTVRLPGATGSPLGVEDTSYEEQRAYLGEGTIVAFYTTAWSSAVTAPSTPGSTRWPPG
jgi:serine phosphatase RsbU (regulator of sigma subunit)